jgi:hypothetical protein
MSSPFNQHHWIEELASKERDRQSDIRAFQAAAKAFLPILAKALQSDMDKFNDEFKDPLARASMKEISHDKGIIVVTCAMYNPTTVGTVGFIPQASQIGCEYAEGYRHHGWNEKLEVSALGLQYNGLAPEYGAKDLAKKILKPVLFPWF